MPSIIPISVGLTITLSAFLLFQVQPLFARVILPWFGGSPSVWITVLVFFQCLLLFGYIYADLLVRKVKLPIQLVIHIFLILLALLFLDLTPHESSKSLVQSAPVKAILIMMASHIAFPYFLLSSTAPLLQGWLAITSTKQPLRFYALSNAASLAALLSFPLLFEKIFGTAQQINFWSKGFIAFAVSIFTTATLLLIRSLSQQLTERTNNIKSHTRVDFITFAHWCLLSMTGVMLLLSVTSFLSYDVAAAPLLWVLPLSVYLLSFIFTFSGDTFYKRKLYIPTGIICVLLFLDGRIITPDLPVTYAVSYTLVCLFIWCMICHGELVKLRPQTDSLTLFYLALSLGGALGGLSIGIIAPYIFNSFLELPISLILLLALLAVPALKSESKLFGRHAPFRYRTTLKLSFIGLVAAVTLKISLGQRDVIDQRRNFYGVLQVIEHSLDSPSMEKRVQKHGQIVHGSQFQLEAKKLFPTEYYGKDSGLGAAIELLHSRTNLDVGIVGLGVGTIKAYAREGDKFVMYEINPDVVYQAKKYFTFLDSTPGSYAVVLGDGRLSLTNDTTRKFDLLVLDAFSSDSIPVHLLTIEAFKLYLDRIKEDGVLAVHVSNRHLDVAEVVLKIAEVLNIDSINYSGVGNEDLGTSDSEWVIISKDKSFLDLLKGKGRTGVRKSKLERAWSDDFSNLISILQ